MQNRPTKNQAEATSACDIYKALLASEPQHNTRYEDYSCDLSELKRAKNACQMGMVVKPTSSIYRPSHTLFISPEEYSNYLEQAQQKSENSKLKYVYTKGRWGF